MTEFLDFLEISFFEDSGSSGYRFSEVLAAGRSNGEQTMVSCWSLRLMPVIFDGQALLKQHIPKTGTWINPAIDNFLKNVGTSAESIKMQATLMGAAAASEIEWNEPFFCDCFDNVAKIVNWISRKQKSFTRFQFIVS